VADKLALLKLYDDVQARFDSDGTACTMAFGWRPPAQQQLTAARITWTPGDADGKIGEVGAPRRPGRDPRPLGTLHEFFTVEFFAFDPAEPENERLQYQAVRFLFDTWFRAVYLAAYGTFAIVENEWILTSKERRHGAALRVTATIDAMIPDAANTYADADLMAATGDVSELTHTESMTVTQS